MPSMLNSSTCLIFPEPTEFFSAAVNGIDDVSAIAITAPASTILFVFM
jgi:hypothetical protein